MKLKLATKMNKTAAEDWQQLADKMEIMVERIPHNGHLVLTTFYGDEMLEQVYIGYTLEEAKKRFREYIKNWLQSSI